VKSNAKYEIEIGIFLFRFFINYQINYKFNRYTYNYCNKDENIILQFLHEKN
jgi:hypothetical protein